MVLSYSTELRLGMVEESELLAVRTHVQCKDNQDSKVGSPLRQHLYLAHETPSTRDCILIHTTPTHKRS